MHTINTIIWHFQSNSGINIIFIYQAVINSARQ